ncbi:MAG: EAL domain-containing protein [Pseudomonadota bacterium]|nr:EAL domain-containing protein [Pseudomonadota bacterium]
MNETSTSKPLQWIFLAALAVMLLVTLVMWSDVILSNSNPHTAVLVISIGGFLTCAVIWIFMRQRTISKMVQEQVVLRTHELENTSRKFRVITDNAYDLISILTLDGHLDYTNSAYHRILGYSREELKNKPFVELVHENDMAGYAEAIHRIIENSSSEEVTLRLKHKKGYWVYLESVAKGFYSSNWQLSGIVIHSRDISKRKKYADELARSEQRFRDFADSSADWLWEVNERFEFTYISPGIKQTLGFTSEEMIGRMKLDALFSKNSDMTRELIESRVERRQPYRDIEFWTKSKEGERVCLRISAVPVFNEKQEFTGYRGAATNITTSKLDRENMFRLATTDHLTGLLNRARFGEELDRTLSLAKRHKSQGVLLFIDLDQFKSVNDTYGHDAGDALIRSVAEVLGDNVRSTDIVARLGGDEFGIIMHNIDVNRAKVKVQKIINKLDALRVPYNGVTIHCTMSIGMIPYPQEERDSTGLLMSADLAMYRAKELGRNRLYIYGEDNGKGGNEDNDTMVERKDTIKAHLQSVQNIRSALETGKFEMHYQPIVPYDNQNCEMHYEALVRIRDEKDNIIPPGLFIEAAEQYGLIQKLDLCVVERCIQQQLDLEKKGHAVNLSINLSGKSIGDHDMLKELKRIVTKYKKRGFKPQRITFEVTETAAMNDPTAVKELEKLQSFIAVLKNMGFKFSLDDFGTGYSSFNYIKHLNVDYIKIDGSFILPLENSEKDRVFVKAIVDLAKGLGLKTVAEFVENEKILRILNDLGIDMAQGYHLSKPEIDLEKLDASFSKKSIEDFITKKV